jgi:hypothetical protein
MRYLSLANWKFTPLLEGATTRDSTFATGTRQYRAREDLLSIDGVGSAFRNRTSKLYRTELDLAITPA